MKIKFENSYTKKCIVYNFDFRNHTVDILKDETPNDALLKIMFKYKTYNELVNWIRARVGGKSLKEAIEIAKSNNLRSVKDDILVKIL